jgi:hypothetical protein
MSTSHEIKIRVPVHDPDSNMLVGFTTLPIDKKYLKFMIPDCSPNNSTEYRTVAVPLHDQDNGNIDGLIHLVIDGKDRILITSIHDPDTGEVLRWMPWSASGR